MLLFLYSSNNETTQFKLSKYSNIENRNKLIKVWKCINNKKIFEKQVFLLLAVVKIPLIVLINPNFYKCFTILIQSLNCFYLVHI